MSDQNSQLQTRPDETLMATPPRSHLTATSQFMDLVTQFTKLVGENGTGAVMFGIGAALIITVIVGGFVPHTLGGSEVVAGLVAGALLIVAGSATRIWANSLTMRSALETDKLHSQERLEELRMETRREIAKYRIEGYFGDEAGQRRSDERQTEGGTRSSSQKTQRAD